MPRLSLALATILLSAPLHAQTEPDPDPATCPAGQIADPDGTCEITRGIGSKGSIDGGKDAGGMGGDSKGGGGITGTAGSPDI